jgi:hypothetical protein
VMTRARDLDAQTDPVCNAAIHAGGQQQRLCRTNRPAGSAAFPIRENRRRRTANFSLITEAEGGRALDVPSPATRHGSTASGDTGLRGSSTVNASVRAVAVP